MAEATASRSRTTQPCLTVATTTHLTLPSGAGGRWSRSTLDLLAEVEGEPGNHIRVPLGVAKRLAENHGVNVWETRKVPKNLLVDHGYVKTDGKKSKHED